MQTDDLRHMRNVALSLTKYLLNKYPPAVLVLSSDPTYRTFAVSPFPNDFVPRPGLDSESQIRLPSTVLGTNLCVVLREAK